MTENEIKNAIRTINAKLEEALEREKETEGTEDTVIWHMVGNDYKCAIKALEEIQQYRAIGTVEECREERERQRAKKVKNRKLLRDFHNRPYSVRGNCPICGSEGLLSSNTDYCNACGQKLDWSENNGE